MAFWLLKSEPDTYSIEDLKNEPGQVGTWDGVRNYKARNYLRDEMQVGDKAFFYHSSCETPAIVGIVKIVRAGYPDPTAFNPKSPYYDPKTSPDNPRWFMVQVKFERKLKNPITLKDIKNNPKLAKLTLVQKGNRLSVMPIKSNEWETILAMLK
jgi:predicted RNA-binding protein with PUA-like domain